MTRRYTIVIRSHVNRRISPYTIVYDCVCSTWEQCSVQLSSQTTDNSTLPIDHVPDVSQIQSLITPNPNSSESVHTSMTILNYLKTVSSTRASIADICK